MSQTEVSIKKKKHRQERKNRHMELHQAKQFLHGKGDNHQSGKNTRENVWKPCIWYNGLISKMYEEFLQLNSKNPTNLIEKNGQRTPIFVQRRCINIQWVSREKILNIIKEIKTIVRYHLTPVGTDVIKNKATQNPRKEQVLMRMWEK